MFDTVGTTITFLNLFILLIIVAGIIGGIVALQIFLSEKESKWPGLVLPIIAFSFSFMVAFVVVWNIATFTATLEIYTGIIQQNAERVVDRSSFIMPSIYGFLIANIPTAILLAIYIACRNKRNKQRDLEKMNLQDL